jgi:hypothetical protein
VTTNYQLQPGDRIVVGSRSFCEEMAFWKQSKDCIRCSRSCCVECQPTRVQYQNHFAGSQQSFSLPAQQKAQRSNVGSPPIHTITDSESKPDLKSDEDLFLPPLKSDAQGKEMLQKK